MNKEEFEKLINKRYANKEELEKVQYCGCDNCHRVFETKLIKEWIKEEQLYILDGNGKMKVITEGYTAKCPYCENDNVIPLANKYEQANKTFKKFLAYENQERIQNK